MAIVSQNIPKIPREGIFRPKLKHFSVFSKFSNQASSRVLIGNMTKLFSNSTAKIHKSRIFGLQFRHFCFFCEIFQIDKFEGADFKSDNSLFKVLFQKYPNKTFSVKNTQITHFRSKMQAFSLFHDVLRLDNFEGVDFKYENICFHIPAQKYPITHFTSQIQTNLQLDKFEDADFKYDNSFSNSTPKIPKQGTFGPKFKDFFFTPNFGTRHI